MSKQNIIDFYNILEHDPSLKKTYESLVADNVSVIVLVKLASNKGFTFTTQELKDYLIESWMDKREYVA